MEKLGIAACLLRFEAWPLVPIARVGSSWAQSRRSLQRTMPAFLRVRAFSKSLLVSAALE